MASEGRDLSDKKSQNKILIVMNGVPEHEIVAMNKGLRTVLPATICFEVNFDTMTAIDDGIRSAKNAHIKTSQEVLKAIEIGIVAYTIRGYCPGMGTIILEPPVVFL